MAPHNHHLKRLQHSTNSLDSCSTSPNDEDESIQESVQNFSISSNNHMKFFRFKPAPHQARRGGARPSDRIRYSSVSLPKRTINYDLAESFMDHSTNPLSSDLYKIRFKYSAKQWPNGRFVNHKEKLDGLDGNIIDITCTRTFPIVSKRKRRPEIEQTTIETPSSIVIANPTTQEQKKKLADKQTNLYANLFGCGKNSQVSTTSHIKKTNCISNSTKSSTSNFSLGENKEDQKY